MDLEITISAEAAAVLSSHEEQDSDIADILRAVIEEHTEEMAGYVDFYMTHDRGTLTGDVELAEDGDGPVTFDSSTNRGVIYIQFQEEAYYGCRDMDDYPDHDEEVPFSLYLENRKILIHFPDPADRESDEEF